MEIIIYVQLVLAMLLGVILGAERTIAGKTAGMRTYALVSLGSCLLIVVSKLVTAQYLAPNEADSLLRIVAGVITGMGFLGAGVIFSRESHINGLTTAAGLWIASGIGIAVGFEYYLVATFSAFLTLFTFTVLWYVEKEVRSFSAHKQENHE
jgi:putative Mg2+ transporter-C (MgtC) family protein